MNTRETETASHDMDSKPDQYIPMQIGQSRVRFRKPMNVKVNAICPIGAHMPNIFRNITLKTAYPAAARTATTTPPRVVEVLVMPSIYAKRAIPTESKSI